MNSLGSFRQPVVALCFAFVFLTAGEARGATINVAAGGNLQAAIDAAQPGDTIVLQAGATFTGNFVLPVKPGSTYITIQSTPSAGLPAADVRIGPHHAPLLAKIRAGNTMAAIRTAAGAHHWRLMLLELLPNSEGLGEIIQLGDGSSAQNQLSQVPHDLELDRVYIHGDPLLGQKRGVGLNAAAVTIKNCHISDIKAVGAETQAIGGWNGPGPFTIDNNYLEASGVTVLFGGADPSIPNLVSDDIKVRGNHMARPMSWRDPVVGTATGLTATPVSGGSLPTGTYGYQVIAQRNHSFGSKIRSTVSAEITASVVNPAHGAVIVQWAPVANATEYFIYRRSPGGTQTYWIISGTSLTDIGTGGTVGAAPTTPGDTWVVKNLFELKNARNVVVEGNVFENNWASGQAGYAILFTPRNQEGRCTWCVVENVVFRHNIVRHAGGGFIITGSDNNAPSQLTQNITIVGNLIYGISQSYGGHGWLASVARGPRTVVLDHNTVDSDGYAIVYISGPEPVYGYQFLNNAARHNDYGLAGSDYAFGNDILTNYFPGAVVRRNWLQGGPASRYPADNLFAGTFDSGFVNRAAGDYRAVSGGILSGGALDGTDIGAPMAAIIAWSDLALSGRGLPPPKNLRVFTR